MNRTLVLSLTAALALPLAAQDRAPEVTRKGRTVVMYKDAAVQAVVGYRWMNANPKATWVPMQFAISASSSNKTIDIAREDVTLVTPSGERIPLPTQKQFLEGVPQPERILSQVSIARDPIAGYFPGRLRVESMSLFAVQRPGGADFRHDERGELPMTGRTNLAYDRFTVDRSTLAIGLLWFPLPTGVLPGTYHLEIENKWAKVSVPFDVPAPPLGKGGAKETGVEW